MISRVDGEDAHSLSIWATKNHLTPVDRVPDPPEMGVSVWGKRFSNPIGLAAGCDKQGEAIEGFLAMGFGFMEIGSVAPKPQPGSARPRVFRLVKVVDYVIRMIHSLLLFYSSVWSSRRSIVLGRTQYRVQDSNFICLNRIMALSIVWDTTVTVRIQLKNE